jgi:hypothetical protein
MFAFVGNGAVTIASYFGNVSFVVRLQVMLPDTRTALEERPDEPSICESSYVPGAEIDNLTSPHDS